MAAAPVLIEPGDLAKIAPCSCCAYFLDVDGTLLDIMPRPEDVVADEPLRRLLSRVSAAANGALALVGGRALKDIDRIFAPLIFPAAALHGADIRFPDGSRSSATSEAAMAGLRRPVAKFAAAHNGLRLEDKGASLAIHFRQAPHLAHEVMEFAASLARANGLAVQEGKMVAELKDPQHDKGKGIAALLAKQPFSNRKPVFIGDDLTDESGFRLINAHGGISVRVGVASYGSEASFFLFDPAAVRAELRRLLPDD